MRRGGSFLAALMFGVAALLGGPAPAGADSTARAGSEIALEGDTSPYDVRATKRSELWPATDGTYLAWAENSAATPRRFRALVRTPTGKTFQVNRPGTMGFPGGIDNSRLVFREVDKGASHIRMVNLATRKRMALPSQVNTRASEYAPSISGEWLLFGREERISRNTWRSKVYLWNLVTGNFKLVASSSTPGFVMPGQVNGDWATWTTCGNASCSVIRYQLSTGKRSRIPVAELAYSSSVGSDGTVYFGNSAQGCGKKVGFYRYPVGGPGQLLFTLPPGRDILSSQAHGSNPTRVVFAQVNCPRPGRIFQGDIRGSAVPATVEPPNPRPDPAIGAGSVTYQVNPTHSGRIATATLKPPLRQLWSTTVGMAPSYPLLAEDKVFAVVRNNQDYGTKLFALDAGTGRRVWFRDVPGTYYWSGIAYEDGRVFVLNYDGRLQALNASNGELLWERELAGQYSFSSEPSVRDGVLYTAGSGSGGTLYAIRVQDGSVLWTRSVDNGDHTSPAVSSDTVFTTHACTSVWAFDRLMGLEKWHYETDCQGGGGRTPVFHDGYLYARDGSEGSILDARTGTLVDRFVAGSAPALADDTAYNVRNGVLEARGVPGGSRRWLFEGDRNLYVAPVVAGGYVYVGSLSGKLYALDRTGGRLAWSTDVGPVIRGPDEHNVAEPVSGLGLGEAILVVPNGRRLTAFVSKR